MNLSENLHYLRKRNKITQEELADRLGVSRQSVSKWETGEAYPETDKLISLCDIFSVTLDELVRSDLTTAEETEIQHSNDTGFNAHMNKFSKCMASGVFLVLIGVAVCIALAGSALYVEGIAPVMDILCVVSVLTAVAGAVFLFVYYGIKHDNFCKEHPVIENIYGEKEVKAFNKRFNLAMAMLVTGVMLDVIFLVVTSYIIDADSAITGNKEDGLYCCVVSVFMAVLAFLVGGMVYFGIQHTKFNTAEYNKQVKKEGTVRSKIKNAICSAVMLTATALFLILGFVGGWWHPGWVVFPVGGMICGIVSAIIDAKND